MPIQKKPIPRFGNSSDIVVSHLSNVTLTEEILSDSMGRYVDKSLWSYMTCELVFADSNELKCKSNLTHLQNLKSNRSIKYRMVIRENTNGQFYITNPDSIRPWKGKQTCDFTIERATNALVPAGKIKKSSDSLGSERFSIPDGTSVTFDNDWGRTGGKKSPAGQYFGSHLRYVKLDNNATVVIKVRNVIEEEIRLSAVAGTKEKNTSADIISIQCNVNPFD